jgi:hypothetical protein
MIQGRLFTSDSLQEDFGYVLVRCKSPSQHCQTEWSIALSTLAAMLLL